MLAEGEVDAVIHPDIIIPILRGDKRVRRLFEDYRAKKHPITGGLGYFIMHATAIRNEILEEHPWVSNNWLKVERAKHAHNMHEQPTNCTTCMVSR